MLPQLERGHDIERHAHDEPERAERDDCSVEIVVRAAEAQERAVCADELERSDRGGERLVARAGTVRRRCDRSADRDVRQRRVVRDREPVPGERATQLAVADARFHDDRFGSDLDDPVEVLGREENPRRVCDAAERMARPERSEQLRLRDHLLRLCDRARRENAVGRVRHVTGPVLHRCNALNTETPHTIATTPVTCTRVSRSLKRKNDATAAMPANCDASTAATASPCRAPNA